MRTSTRFARFWVLLAMFAFASAAVLWANEPSDDANQEAAEEAASDDKPADPYAIPDGDAEALTEFIDRMGQQRPQGTDRDQLIADYTKIQKAIVGASDKLLALEIDEEMQVDALSAKLQALMVLAQLDEATAATEIDKMVEPVKKIVVEGPKDRKHFILANSLAQSLEKSGGNREAADLYRQLAEMFADSDDQAVAKYVTKLDGIARRLTLLGQPMEITGTLVDGTPFDWKKYQGKVVLVDFWATWCGPCKAELPNVLENYERYHDRGFEVVGISLDEDREALETFLAENEIPWATLFSNDPEATGWNHPMADYYGIMAIPAVLLVGQDGTVKSLHARGEKLGELLAEQLGPVEEAASTSDDTSSESAK